MRAAVVGHVEWVEFVRVEAVPTPGEIVHALEWWQEPGGGGAGAAVQLAKLTGDATFFTALGDDELGHRAEREIKAMGVDVHAVFRPEPTRRAVTHVDATGERTITVLGERHEPRGDEDLPWHELRETDAVYFTAGDFAALGHARTASVVVATSRFVSRMQGSGIELDAIVGSETDRSETYRDGDLEPAPKLVVRTKGGEGGTFQVRGGPDGSWKAGKIPGPIADRYGAGDSFAAGLTYALGRGLDPQDAVELAARCGASALTGRGPYEGQLTAAELGV